MLERLHTYWKCEGATENDAGMGVALWILDAFPDGPIRPFRLSRFSNRHRITSLEGETFRSAGHNFKCYNRTDFVKDLGQQQHHFQPCGDPGNPPK